VRPDAHGIADAENFLGVRARPAGGDDEAADEAQQDALRAEPLGAHLLLPAGGHLVAGNAGDDAHGAESSSRRPTAEQQTDLVTSAAQLLGHVEHRGTLPQPCQVTIMADGEGSSGSADAGRSGPRLHTECRFARYDPKQHRPSFGNADKQRRRRPCPSVGSRGSAARRRSSP
jgi:hypothetical protein